MLQIRENLRETSREGGQRADTTIGTSLMLLHGKESPVKTCVRRECCTQRAHWSLRVPPGVIRERDQGHQK